MHITLTFNIYERSIPLKKCLLKINEECRYLSNYNSHVKTGFTDGFSLPTCGCIDRFTFENVHVFCVWSSAVEPVCFLLQPARIHVQYRAVLFSKHDHVAQLLKTIYEVHYLTIAVRITWPFLEPQSQFEDKPPTLQVVYPQNRTVALKGLIITTHYISMHHMSPQISDLGQKVFLVWAFLKFFFPAWSRWDTRKHSKGTSTVVTAQRLCQHI